MPSEFDTRMDEQNKRIMVQIDDYKDTIYAILGFLSLWRYDSAVNKTRDYVKVFQGRRLTPSSQDSESGSATADDVCPDLGVVVRDEAGILGEVKKNFPRSADEKRQQKIFAQLKSYDRTLFGWPTHDQQLGSHELVLLVHQTTSRLASDSYREELRNGVVQFDRPFSIVEFNRADQRAAYFLFRLVEGKIGCVEGNVDLYNGIPVPMEALTALYSETKLYDAEPPIAYLAHLMWEHVFTPIASEDPKFARLRKDSKLDIIVTVDRIVEELREGFSFSRWHSQHIDRQPAIPKREWVEKACDFMVKRNEANWIKERVELLVYYRKYADILEHFVQSQAESVVGKPSHPTLPGFDSV